MARAAQDIALISNHLAVFILKVKGEMSREELQIAAEIKHWERFRKEYLIPAIQLGLIEMTIPSKPNSKLQKYRLTQAGFSYKTLNLGYSTRDA